MNECLLALFGGLAGSAHCVGMCGGLVVSLGVRGQEMAALRRQLIYAAGRVFTYSFAGLAAGYAGLRFGSELDTWPAGRAVLQLVGGLALIVVGLELLGLLPWRAKGDAGCLGPALFEGLRGSARGVFFAGMINGLLPCGLVYAWLAVAFSTASLLRGAAVMACFGVGTIPALAALGAGARWLPCSARHTLARVGGWIVVGSGVALVATAAYGFVVTPVDCPLCGPHGVG
ncbi:MAG: sulfite exporter TauE/SafE family protein [Gemmataceae bacterium]|nr:sulfite exporter TauE/SafE family protein [Gemmataceae bacterium]